jgi:MarR family transcriptional regulator, negative regulator of the multidrug operon emrRAB
MQMVPGPSPEGGRARSSDRGFAANLLGTLALTITDRVGIGTAQAARHGGGTPAALLCLWWYPDRPIAFLAARLRISHPGAVQLVDRLAEDGLAERVPAVDGRTKLLALTDRGRAAAAAVLQARGAVLQRAVDVLDDEQLRALSGAVEAMLEALSDTLLTGEYMCRMCDELSCPDARCPVERATPTPPHRRGTGYGVAEATVDGAATAPILP